MAATIKEKPVSNAPQISVTPEVAERFRKLAKMDGRKHWAFLSYMLDIYVRHRRRNGK